MRTTLTLDEDLAVKLKAAARRSGRSFRDIVNEALRRGLMAERAGKRVPFKVETRSLGGARPGIRFDGVAELLEQVEGPLHR